MKFPSKTNQFTLDRGVTPQKTRLIFKATQVTIKITGDFSGNIDTKEVTFQDAGNNVVIDGKKHQLSAGSGFNCNPFAGMVLENPVQFTYYHDGKFQWVNGDIVTIRC